MDWMLDENIAFRQIDDEYIVIHSGQGVFLTLNMTAGYILENLNTVSSVREMALQMADTFDCDPERTEADTTEFLRIAHTEGIIRPGHTAPVTGGEGIKQRVVNMPYARPEILSRENLQAVAGLCDSGHSGGSACRTSPPFCVQLFS